MSSPVVSSKRFRLPNGVTVNSLTPSDTLIVYRDIFEDRCYLRHGVTVRDGDTVVDVGGNTGLFVLHLNTLLTSARVLTFEPIPDTCAVLKQNLAEHDKLGAQAFAAGICDQDGRAEFTYYPRFSNASTMLPDSSVRTAQTARQYIIDQIPTLSQPWRFLCGIMPRFLQVAIADVVRRFHLKAKRVSCEVRSLSSVMREHGIGRVDLLKIDAERAELRILAGVAEADWPKIRQTIIEVHDGAAAVKAVVDLLEGKGFRVVAEPNPAMPELALVYARRE